MRSAFFTNLWWLLNGRRRGDTRAEVMMSAPMMVTVTMTGMVSASTSLCYGLGGLFMAMSRVSLEASRGGRHGNQAGIAGGRIFIFSMVAPASIILFAETAASKE